MTAIGLIETVEVSGSPYERGKRFGEVRRARISAWLADWLGSLRSADIDSPRDYLARMLRETDFLTAIRAHTPDLLEEVEGIAAGADQPFDLMLASELMDEEWAYRLSIRSSERRFEKCSSVAVRGDGGTVIGQNMDLGGYTDGHQVLMYISPDSAGNGALIFTMGGMIALMGGNGSGLAVCVNSLPQLPSAREGLPVAFVIRKLLQANSVREAVGWLHSMPHATGQHYLIADPFEIESCEACAAGVFQYRPEDSSRVLHTNHPLAEGALALADRKEAPDSLARLASLRDRLQVGCPDIEAVKAALSSRDDRDHPVCKCPDPQRQPNPLTGMISFTTGSMISQLDRDSAVVTSWISNGPPCLRGYERIELPKSTVWRNI